MFRRFGRELVREVAKEAASRTVREGADRLDDWMNDRNRRPALNRLPHRPAVAPAQADLMHERRRQDHQCPAMSEATARSVTINRMVGERAVNTREAGFMQTHIQRQENGLGASGLVMPTTLPTQRILQRAAEDVARTSEPAPDGDESGSESSAE